MKKYKTSWILYMILPVIITVVILVYMAFIYAKSDIWVNVFNLGLDVIILIYYFKKFCTEITVSVDKIYLICPVSRCDIDIKDIKKVVSSSFLIKLITKKGSYYIISSKKDSSILDEIISIIKEKMH